MKICVITNSYKGTLSSEQAAKAIAEGLLLVDPTLEISELPLADGGEGSASVVSRYKELQEVCCSTFSPFGSPVTGCYRVSCAGTAYIDFAAASGISFSHCTPEESLRASSYGTGVLVRDAIRRGARKIYLFLGGSATTDAGVGLAKALGAQFYTEDGGRLPSLEEDGFVGESLDRVARVELSGCIDLSEVRLNAVVDVRNPLFGKNGAARIYGPQKGASGYVLDKLEAGLENIANCCLKERETAYSAEPGMGAAGGAAFGLCALFGANLLNGPEYFLGLAGFERELANTDLVFTGEGKLDQQSLDGKLLSAVLARTTEREIPTIAINGLIDVDYAALQAFPNLAVIGMGRPEALEQPFSSLRETAAQIFRIWKLATKKEFKRTQSPYEDAGHAE